MVSRPNLGCEGGFPEEVILSEPEGTAGVDEMIGKENISDRGKQQRSALGRKRPVWLELNEVEHGRG